MSCLSCQAKSKPPAKSKTGSFNANIASVYVNYQNKSNFMTFMKMSGGKKEEKKHITSNIRN